jgi:excisionase family DNA binding protein
VITIDIDYDELAATLASRLAQMIEPTKTCGFLDVDGAAGYLSSTATAIRSLVKRNAIPYHKAPNGRLLFDRDELEAWVRSG